MSELKELRRLQDEERALMNIATKLSDQLNRLKVEELALLNMIRVKEGKDMDEETKDVPETDEIIHAVNVEDQADTNKEEVGKEGSKEPEKKKSGLVSLDLAVSKQGVEEQMEEEEEEDDDDLEMMNAFNDPV